MRKIESKFKLLIWGGRDIDPVQDPSAPVEGMHMCTCANSNPTENYEIFEGKLLYKPSSKHLVEKIYIPYLCSLSFS